MELEFELEPELELELELELEVGHNHPMAGTESEAGDGAKGQPRVCGNILHKGPEKCRLQKINYGHICWPCIDSGFLGKHFRIFFVLFVFL